mgnify:CR=1 FL=1
MKFCLIGEKLGHSFSVPIHRFYGAEYELREIARDSLGDFVKNCPFDGFNVTIPYKTEIMRYLDEVDPRAAKIGSVNTVVYRGGKSVGYNTDIDGMAEMLAFQGIPLGLQCFKFARLALLPFGKEIVYGGPSVCGFLANVLWLLLFGWSLALLSGALGLVLCVTVVGIPFGLQCFKFSKLALMPFGASVR